MTHLQLTWNAWCTRSNRRTKKPNARCSLKRGRFSALGHHLEDAIRYARSRLTRTWIQTWRALSFMGISQTDKAPRKCCLITLSLSHVKTNRSTGKVIKRLSTPTVSIGLEIRELRSTRLWATTTMNRKVQWLQCRWARAKRSIHQWLRSFNSNKSHRAQWSALVVRWTLSKKRQVKARRKMLSKQRQSYV